MTDKKYDIVSSLVDDAAYGNINWYTISFLTPQSIDKLANVDIKAFKIHNGYNILELAEADAKKLKERDNKHDIYVCQTGKILSWDDSMRSESMEYDDEKMNDLEKTRRQNANKVNLMREQFKNEFKQAVPKHEERNISIRNKLRERLHKQGKLTKDEYEKMAETTKVVPETEKLKNEQDLIRSEMDAMDDTDFLTENLPVSLKYGCVTIYSPKKIGGLSTLCFKIRGLFENTRQLNKRVNELKKNSPHDNICTFEIGKWTGFSEYTEHEPSYMLKLLNYCMKMHEENMLENKREFETRKEEIQKKQELNPESIPSKTNKKRKIVSNDDSLTALDPVDQSGIEEIYNMINDPDLTNKFKL